MLKQTAFLTFWRSLNATRAARGLAPLSAGDAARAYYHAA